MIQGFWKRMGIEVSIPSRIVEKMMKNEMRCIESRCESGGCREIGNSDPPIVLSASLRGNLHRQERDGVETGENKNKRVCDPP